MGLFDWYDEKKHIQAVASSKPLAEDLKISLQKYVDRNYGKPYITQAEKEQKVAEERQKKRELERKRLEEEHKQKEARERKRREEENKKKEKEAKEHPEKKEVEEQQNNIAVTETSKSGGSDIKFSISVDNEVRYSVSSRYDYENLSSDADDFFGSYTNFKKYDGQRAVNNSLNNFGNIPGYKPPKRFQDYLTEYINRSGMTNVEVYKRANLSKSVFSSIFSDYNRIPKKSTVVALALALKLNLKDTEMLLMKAGYTFSNSIIADLVVVYFINKKKYDIDEINRALFELKQPILGSKSY